MQYSASGRSYNYLLSKRKPVNRSGLLRDLWEYAHFVINLDFFIRKSRSAIDSTAKLNIYYNWV